MKRTAKMASRAFKEPWECFKPWPEDCGVQCGSGGIVLTKPTLEEAFGTEEGGKEVIEAVLDKKKKGGYYRTAFFEAFPKNPKTFIRGEGKTIKQAEEEAWGMYQKYLACPGHEFERRGYKNGAGFCKHCGMFASKVFDPTTKCEECGKPSAYSEDQKGKTWCEEHLSLTPQEDRWPIIPASIYDKKPKEEPGGKTT